MTPGQIIISFLLATIVTAFFAGFLRAAGPWKGFWIFFIIIFVVSLAASQWVTPVGPATYGYYWIPGLFATIIFAILLAAVTPKGNKKSNSNDEHTRDTQDAVKTSTKVYYSPKNVNPSKRIYEGDEPANAVAIGGFFWLFISLLMLAVIIGAVLGK